MNAHSTITAEPDLRLELYRRRIEIRDRFESKQVIANRIYERRQKLIALFKSFKCEEPLPSPRLQDVKCDVLNTGAILKFVAIEFGFSVKDLKSPRRPMDLVIARHVAMYLADKLTSQSLVEIGKNIGGKDHTTVMHGRDKAIVRIAASPALAARVDRIIAAIAERFPAEVSESRVPNEY